MLRLRNLMVLYRRYMITKFVLIMFDDVRMDAWKDDIILFFLFFFFCKNDSYFVSLRLSIREISPLIYSSFIIRTLLSIVHLCVIVVVVLVVKRKKNCLRRPPESLTIYSRNFYRSLSRLSLRNYVGQCKHLFCIDMHVYLYIFITKHRRDAQARSVLKNLFLNDFFFDLA